jgi:hypothetical protein
MRAKFNAASMTTQQLAGNVAHENTAARMSEAHDLPVLYRGSDGRLSGLHFDPSPTPCPTRPWPTATRCPDSLVSSRGRVQKLKAEGKPALEAVAEKPFADLDNAWGQGIINSDQFVQIVYLTL